jgi:hypothetical protein
MGNVIAFAATSAGAQGQALADSTPSAASARAEAALAAATGAGARRALLRERKRLATDIARAALDGGIVEASRPPPRGAVQVHPLDVVEALLREAAAMLAVYDGVPPCTAARIAGAAARGALSSGD